MSAWPSVGTSFALTCCAHSDVHIVDSQVDSTAEVIVLQKKELQDTATLEAEFKERLVQVAAEVAKAAAESRMKIANEAALRSAKAKADGAMRVQMIKVVIGDVIQQETDALAANAGYLQSYKDEIVRLSKASETSKYSIKLAKHESSLAYDEAMRREKMIEAANDRLVEDTQKVPNP